MKVIPTELEDVVIIEPKIFGDERGYFLETWNAERYKKSGLAERFVQDNLSYSQRGVLRGLHYQYENTQGKLVYVLQGEVFDVAVDIRKNSPDYGKWTGVYLSAENKRQLYVPEGFAHGFCVTSETALFAYKCTDSYNPAAEVSIAWNDPEIGVEWPCQDPELSEKDKKGVSLSTIPVEQQLA